MALPILAKQKIQSLKNYRFSVAEQKTVLLVLKGIKPACIIYPSELCPCCMGYFEKDIKKLGVPYSIERGDSVPVTGVNNVYFSEDRDYWFYGKSHCVLIAKDNKSLEQLKKALDEHAKDYTPDTMYDVGIVLGYPKKAVLDHVRSQFSGDKNYPVFKETRCGLFNVNVWTKYYKIFNKDIPIEYLFAEFDLSEPEDNKIDEDERNLLKKYCETIEEEYPELSKVIYNMLQERKQAILDKIETGLEG